MTRLIPVLAFSLTLCLYLTEPADAKREGAQAGLQGEQGASVRLDTPSGLPVPRLVSLKSTKTYCRAGPSFDHKVRLTFMRQGLPVVVVAETRDHWRKIRDMEGDSCWTHKSKLSGARTVLVLEDGLALRSKPNSAAPARARLGRGVVAQVEKTRDGWLKISANGKKGWADSAALWGALADSPVIAGP